MKDNNSPDSIIKKEIIRAGRSMYASGFAAANDGNISVRTRENEVWITPSGVSKGFMSEDILCRIDLSGNLLSGITVPSSEAKMHLRLYNENPEITAVVHAHPPFCTAFAAEGLPLDKALIQEAVVLLGTVPLAGYALPGSEEMADSVAPFALTHGAVLLENHGLTAWGKNLSEAMFRLECAENLAKITAIGMQTGFTRLMKESHIDELIALRPSRGIDIRIGDRPKGRPDK